MSRNASYPLQVALTDLAKEIAPELHIYDDVPPDAKMPYTFAGDDDERNIDSQGCAASFHDIQLVVVTSSFGYKDCKAIAARLIDTMHGAQLDIEGFAQTDLTWVSTSYRRHPDAATQRMAIMRFQVELHHNA